MRPDDDEPNSTTLVSIRLISAHNLHRAKVFKRMSPCAVVSAYGDARSSQFLPPVKHGHANPVWDTLLEFSVPDHLLRLDVPSEPNSQDDSLPKPFPHVVVKIYASASLKTSLGRATIPLEQAIRHYDQTHVHFFPLVRKFIIGESACGAIQVEVKVGRTSFAPRKGTAAYTAFVRTRSPFCYSHRALDTLSAARATRRLPTTPCCAEATCRCPNHRNGKFSGQPPRTIVVENPDGSIQGFGFRLS
ncbi:hypothetical protein CLOM_g561 [Closterium sp. NIES-68]|nr:hypothetical protein CLOM_g18920 [Closterium sp. NIES-68]GJP40897.1 hypothetical protein CLOM_g561 [Closterium sp. NIES-68]GJP69147.1 hypothetical protein CLOP_g105 [Closterium sp. NIES-67]